MKEEDWIIYFRELRKPIKWKKKIGLFILENWESQLNERRRLDYLF